MTKSTFYLLFLLLVLSCKSSRPIFSEISLASADQITYGSPVFDLGQPTNPDPILFGYERSTRKSLDSLFEVDRGRYQIVNKLESSDSTSFEKQVKSFFESLDKKEQNFQVPEALQMQFDKASADYIMLFSFRPTIALLHDFIPYIRNSYLEVILIDKKNATIMFYDKTSSGTTLNKGYRDNLVADLNRIYARMRTKSEP